MKKFASLLFVGAVSLTEQVSSHEALQVDQNEEAEEEDHLRIDPEELDDDENVNLGDFDPDLDDDEAEEKKMFEEAPIIDGPNFSFVEKKPIPGQILVE